MKSDSPHDVMRVLGAVEDEFAEMQQEHSELQGSVKAGETFFKTLQSTCYDQVEGDSMGEKKERAAALMHTMEDYVRYLRQIKRLEELKRRFLYLENRKSIGQSLLGFMKAELTTTGAGQAEGQVGQGQQ